MFRPRTAPEAIDLVAKLLEYTPEARLSAIEAMCHPFFDELRIEGMRMPNGKEFPQLFNFTREGKWAMGRQEMLTVLKYFFFFHHYPELSIRPDLIRQLVPSHCESELQSRGVSLDNFEPIPLEQLRLTLD